MLHLNLLQDLLGVLALLRIIAGHMLVLEKEQGLKLNVSRLFNPNYSDDWLETDLARRLISEVDHVELSSDKTVRQSLWERYLRPEDLCGGTKAILVIANTPFLISMLMMGENCYKYLFEVAKYQDKRVGLTSYCLPEDSDFSGTVALLENTGDLIRNSAEFDDAYGKVRELFA